MIALPEVQISFLPCKVVVLLHWHFGLNDQMCHSNSTFLIKESMSLCRVELIELFTLMPWSYMTLRQ